MGWDCPRGGVRLVATLVLTRLPDSLILRIFNMPYPLSKRCEVPMEDPTNRGFCRPLPVDLFPIPVLPEMPREGQSPSISTGPRCVSS